MRWISAAIAITFSATAVADQYDEAIATVLRGDWRGQAKLSEATQSVDIKILAALDRIAKSKRRHDRRGVDMLASVLDHRFYSARSNGKTDGIYGASDYRAILILMRLSARYSVSTDQASYSRGPEFYTFLLRCAKSRHTERKAAISMLARTAMIHRRKPGPGDPALIRLFRRERNVYALAGLRDRASIPMMRKQARSLDYSRRQVAASSLVMIGDHDAVPLLLTLLADAPEIQHGPSQSFGPAGYALRELAKPRHADLILRYAQNHQGYPRAFAVNVLGRIGDAGMVAKLKAFESDSTPRVRKATTAAIKALGG